ncbi:MAG: hypothetical protein ACPL7J_03095 [Desulfomonilaceae bacterium]
MINVYNRYSAERTAVKPKSLLKSGTATHRRVITGATGHVEQAAA